MKFLKITYIYMYNILNIKYNCYWQYFFSVTAPPQKVEISNHPNKKKIEVKVGESRRLECVVRSAKPAATITWYRGNIQIKGGETSITPISIEGGEWIHLFYFIFQFWNWNSLEIILRNILSSKICQSTDFDLY